MAKQNTRITQPHKTKNSNKRITAKTSGSQPDTEQFPAFSFRHLCSDKKFSIQGCEKAQKLSLLNHVHKLSGMTWAQIYSSPKHGLGAEKINQDEIRASMPAHVTKDVTFYALRFHGKAPMVGYRDGSVFNILWLDPKFSLYDHG